MGKESCKLNMKWGEEWRPYQ